MATSPHSNPEVAGSSLARSQCPYGSRFTPRLRLAGWRSARLDHLGGWEDRGISSPHLIVLNYQSKIFNLISFIGESKDSYKKNNAFYPFVQFAFLTLQGQNLHVL
ncbi:hypothetical protein Hanom_Chr11g00997421 [Helianthus anomalus]